MKKLQIINEALFENFHKNEVFDELKGIKLSEEQAFNFSLQDEEAEFDELVAKYHVDGGLIGGASLKAPDFTSVVLYNK